MKKLILLVLALTLAMGTVWLPSVAAEDGPPYPITIQKTIPDGGPVEAFTFEAWRDFNNNGIIDCEDPWCDELVGQVVIVGAGTDVIESPYKGATIIREVLIAGSVYEQLPDQVVRVPCGDVTFNNEVGETEVGQIKILKEDPEGKALDGATFEISPNPKTCELPALTVVDEGLNDEALGQPGVLLVSGCQVCCACTVTEIDAPDGYDLDPTPQPAHVTTAGETVTLTFVNTETEEYGQIKILKTDPDGLALDGATFEISPNPKTCELPALTVVDEGLNDEALGQPGVLLVSGCQVCCACTVTEIDAPDGYDLDPTPQPAHVTTAGETVTLTFVNTETEEYGQIKILKTDPDGLALDGATFEISPNPKTCELPALTVVDEGLNDEALGQPGVLLVSGCLVCCECTVTEIDAPDGYDLDPTSQPAHITEAGETVTLTFVNTPPELSCGTVCAAQTAPGQYLFGGGQSNWFTWIYYYKGWGTEGSPKTYPIYTGKTTLCGTLYVYDDGTHIFVNYVLTDTDCTLAGMSEYHLQVDDTLDALKKSIVNKGGNPVPGKCEYKGTLDPMQPETGWIETTEHDIGGWSDPIYIFAHGVGCYYCP